MIPLRDNIPSRSFPIWTLLFVVLNVLAFLYEVSLPGPALERLIASYGVIPARPLMIAFLTSMFLHGGWLHLIGNMWFLWIFGDNVEDRLGHGRFVLFYLACGIAAGLAHYFFNIHSQVPSVGASGAIAGVLGAYMVTFPRARVLTLLPLFIFWQVVEFPAVLFLGLWMVMQLLSGTAAIASAQAEAGGVAWWAHIGGFVAGMVLIKILQPRETWQSA